MRPSDVGVSKYEAWFCVSCEEFTKFHGSDYDDITLEAEYECSTCGHPVSLEHDPGRLMLEENLYHHVIDNGPADLRDLVVEQGISEDLITQRVHESDRLFFDDTARIVAGDDSDSEGEQ